MTVVLLPSFMIHLQILLQCPHDVLIFLQKSLSPWKVSSIKNQIHEARRVIDLQHLEEGHLDGHVIDGIISIFSHMEPFDPHLLLPNHIVPQVSFNPSINYFYLPIYLRMVTSVWDEISD